MARCYILIHTETSFLQTEGPNMAERVQKRKKEHQRESSGLGRLAKGHPWHKWECIESNRSLITEVASFKGAAKNMELHLLVPFYRWEYWGQGSLISLLISDKAECPDLPSREPSITESYLSPHGSCINSENNWMYSKPPTYKPSSCKLTKMLTCLPAPIRHLLYYTTVLFTVLYYKI